MGSLEYIYSEYSNHGYLVDPDRFIAAGGIPGSIGGFGMISAASQTLLDQRLAQLQFWGLVGATYPTTVFSGLWGNLAEPNFTPPKMSDSLAGRTPTSVAASDSIDKDFALSYRGLCLARRHTLAGGLRGSDSRRKPCHPARLDAALMGPPRLGSVLAPTAKDARGIILGPPAGGAVG